MNESDVGQRAISSTVWVFLERIALQAFQFVTTLILARILGPNDFGLIALVSVFIALSNTFIDSGFTKALIQKKETSIQDESTIFFFNLIVSVLFVGLILTFTPFISSFFNEPKILSILPVLSISLLLFALRQIQQVILTKNLNFKLQFKVNLYGTISSGIIGIILAFLGFGIWALVSQIIIEGVVKTIGYWLVSNWRPIFVFSTLSFKKFYKLGSILFFNDLLKSISDNVYGLLIGKNYSPSHLGLYDRANKLVSLVIVNFQFSIQRVTFPLFSKVQDDKTKLKELAFKCLNVLLLIIIPCMVLLAIVAEPLVLILLTDKWIDLVIYIQLFCFYWVLYPFNGINNHLMIALGQSRILFRQSIYIYGLQFFLLIVTFKYGIIAIILGQIISMFFRVIISIYHSGQLVSLGFKKQLGLFFQYLMLALFAGLFAIPLSNFITNSIFLLISQSVTVFLVYTVLIFFFRRDIFIMGKTYFYKFIKQKK